MDNQELVTEEDSKKKVPKKEEVASHFLQLSIRAWLAIMLVATFCVAELSKILLAILSGSPEHAKLSEQFYTAAGMALAFYMNNRGGSIVKNETK